MKAAVNRTHHIGVLFAMLLSGLLASTAPSNSTWWRITFDPAPKPWSKSDPQKTLFIKLTNVSGHATWVFESNFLNDYQLTATDSEGKFMPMTTAGQRKQEDLRSALDRSTVEALTPGSSRTSEINLAELYDLSPGKYFVQAQLRAVTEDTMDKKTNHRKLDAPEPSGYTVIQITR